MWTYRKFFDLAQNLKKNWFKTLHFLKLLSLQSITESISYLNSANAQAYSFDNQTQMFTYPYNLPKICVLDSRFILVVVVGEQKNVQSKPN